MSQAARVGDPIILWVQFILRTSPTETDRMSMDVSNLSSARQSALQTQISMAVAGKQLDAIKTTGDAVGQLLDSALRLSKSTATGQSLDLVG